MSLRVCIQTVLVFAWCAITVTAPAQEFILHLKNGDRISGTIVSTNATEIVVKTAFAGQITVSALQIERRNILAAKPAAAVPAVKAPPVQPPVTPSSPPPLAAAAGTAKPKPPLAAKPLSPSPVGMKTNQPSPFRKFISEWKGEAEVGLNLAFSTKDRQTYAGRFRASHLHSTKSQRTLRNDLDYLVSYGRTDGILSDNRMDGSWKLHYDFRKRFLVYNAVGAGYDEVRKIDLRYDVGPGVGYKWLNRTNFVLLTELGANYQEQFLSDQENKRRYAMRLAEESWWQVANKVRWDEKVEFFPELENFGDYRVRLESNLSYLFRNNLSLKLTVIDLYETNPARGVSNNDLQIRSSLGIKF